MSETSVEQASRAEHDQAVEHEEEASLMIREQHHFASLGEQSREEHRIHVERGQKEVRQDFGENEGEVADSLELHDGAQPEQAVFVGGADHELGDEVVDDEDDYVHF